MNELIQLAILLLGLVFSMIISFKYGEGKGEFFYCYFILIPFQFIDTRIGSFNTFVLVGFCIGLILRGVVKRENFYKPDFFGALLLIFLANCVSLLMFTEGAIFDHLLQVINVVASAIVFVCAYKYCRIHNIKGVYDVSYKLMLLMVVYCIVQMVFGKYLNASVLGEFGMHQNRMDGRIVGPFGAAGVLSNALLVTMLISIWGKYKRIYTGKTNDYIFIVICLAFGMIIATGNRTSFILLVLSFVFVFLIVDYKRFMNMKSIAIGFIVVFFCVTVLYVIIGYTEYNVLFDRLLNTSFDGFTPDTRQGLWDVLLNKASNNAFFGYGPRYREFDAERYYIEWTGQYEYIKPYPHNFWLFVLLTTGIVGVVAYLYFFMKIVYLLINYREGLLLKDSVFFLLVMLIILIDGFKVSFLRFIWADYHQFIFCILGMLVGTASLYKGKINWKFY